MFIAQYNEHTDKAQTLAFSKDNKLIDNFTYTVSHTPCHEVIKKEKSIHTSSLQEKFPENEILKNLNVESYIGQSLKDHQGNTIGVLVGMSTQPIDKLSTILSILSILSDRTALELEQEINYKKLKSALQEKNDLHRIFHHHNLISTTDTKGLIISCNQTFCEISGYSESELIGNNHRILKSGENSDAFYGDLWQTISRGEIWQGTIKNKKKNGEFYWVRATISPMLDTEGTITHYISARTDITYQKQNEERALSLRNKDEQLANTRSMFLANMSHEIRTPLNGIHGAISILLDTKLDKEQEEIAQMVYHSMQSLNVIVNDILDFSKLESGKINLESISLNYKVIVDDVIHLFSEQAQRKHIKLYSEFPIDYPKQLLGDPTRLRQILINLVSNAIKFTPDGEVVIKVNFEKYAEHDYHIQTEVTDTGIGMTAAQLNVLFDPFHQADTSTARLFGGTRLGTTMSKSLIELQKGTLEVYSHLNEGTTFSYSIPAKQTDQKFIQKNLIQKPKRDYDKTVILAEDNLINLKLAKRVLEKLGIHVLVAKNGLEAIQMAHEEEHDMILMDIQMPIMNGLDATQQLIKNGYNKPITAMTASVMDDDLRQYEKLGMAGCIPKPFKVHDIVNILDGLLAPKANLN